MLSRRKIEIIAAVVILVLLLIVLILALRKPKSNVDETPEPEPVIKVLDVVAPADIPSPGVVSAGTVARIFVERFGSYSSESDFANVDDILSLATPSYQAELNNLVADLRNQLDSEAGYVGISTIVIGNTATAEDETSATFLVMTQREEAVGNPGNSSLRYQDAEVSLVKSGDDWLVNGLIWK